LLLALTPFARAQPPAAPGTSSSGELSAPILSKIPTRPSAPPSMSRSAPPQTFQCQRQFVYRGKLLECDSHTNRDAENLRPIISGTPAAVAELDAYQAGRHSVDSLGYVSTLGLVVAGVAFAAFKSSDARPAIWRWTALAGAATAVGGVLYGFSFLSANEQRLGNAVQLHNQAHPDRPIELQFTTGIQF
jgi:hypothetical protein